MYKSVKHNQKEDYLGPNQLGKSAELMHVICDGNDDTEVRSELLQASV
jgi:hypothetical protein